MAYSAIIKPSDYFNTLLYNGNDTADTTITGVGFQSDFTWIKSRLDTENHNLFDAIRGGGYRLYSNLNDAQSYIATTLTSWNSDGFVVGTDDGVNKTNGKFVSWNWKANGAGSANTDGTINSTVSANTTSGFSIVKYTGAGSVATVGHGLGVAPKMIIFKRTDAASDWIVYHTATGSNDFVYLNTTTAAAADSGILNNTSPTSSVFTIGTANGLNGGVIIAYCFAEKTGYSKFGSYVGNGYANGTFSYTGFKPAFVMTKPSSGSGSWYMLDNKRANPFNVVTGRLEADGNGAENTGNTWCDFTSNGFKIRTTEGGINANGVTYIYMAFAESPFVANVGESLPTTAR